MAARTLYINRRLLNAADLLAWARGQGFSETLTAQDVHVTIAFSKAPIDWALVRPAPDGAAVHATDGRAVEPLGEEGAVVLRFESPELSERWRELRDLGASWDFPTYKPHVTITYNGGDVDLSKVEPYTGPLEFGPEIFAEVRVKPAMDADIQAAGMMLTTPDRRALFLRRSGDDHAGEWCFPGGVIEGSEGAKAAALRELFEETGILIDGSDVVERDKRVNDDGVEFTTYGVDVESEVEAELDDEHSEFAWSPLDDPPRPLHPGVESVLSSLAMDGAHISVIAFDRSSVRSYDRDGRLHVATTNISKAAVNPYLGREIPDWEDMGLDPNRIYRLLRDPEELQKAAPTFNNLQLLSRHVAVTADAHQPELVIGSTGTDSEFSGSHLRNSLVIWAKGGIDAVESETQKQLSSAYRYRADMTPGVFEGEKYDGVMRDIVGNHVALVKEGRAGADVVVGDSNEELTKMSKKLLLSRTAILTLGALTAALAPKLAMDAKVDLRPLVVDLTEKNFKDRKPALLIALAKTLDGKLAKDADIEDVTAVLDALQAAPVVEAVAAEAGASATGSDPVVDPDAIDADPLTKIKEFLRAQGVADDVLAQLDAMMVAEQATDETPEEKAEREKKAKLAKDEPPPFKGKPEVGKGPPAITKPAMDAAIASAVKVATDTAVRTQREIRDAEKAVRPYVGELAVAFDSASAVYEAALKGLGVKLDGIPPEAFKAVLEMQPKPGSTHAPRIAMDAAGATDFAKRFPGTDKIQVL